MPDRFGVLPGELKLAGSVFDQEARHTEVHAAEYLVVAPLPDSAFGNLPESYKLANQYQSFFGHVQEDLKALQDSLSDCAKRLDLTAEI
ncbi:MAG: hypothetical protein ABR604_06085 [Jatrophihabitantaceae bacterium]